MGGGQLHAVSLLGQYFIGDFVLKLYTGSAKRVAIIKRGSRPLGLPCRNCARNTPRQEFIFEV
jgi:hypothetical protein